MSLENESKIQKTLRAWPAGTVATSTWFSSVGVSAQLLKKYAESGWVMALGNGAYVKTGDRVGWEGGLYALQTQTSIPVHAGALTALTIQGYAHYLRLGQEKIFLFSPLKTTLPAWFKRHQWSQPVSHYTTLMLPEDFALTDFTTSLFKVRVSTPERAILECLYLSPNTVDLVECYHLLAGLTTLRPKLIQPLLERCRSIKVKRLFLYMADKTGHDWYTRLNLANVALGTGDRRIGTGGVYVARFGITLPEELIKL